ncbi:MAG: coproporphyrinogen III oxidase [Merismopedia sp. SIO2A8]|nr:coproporphyrinogen III oxidase [Symploca sp. SIO2B6]NET47687.1 coproporphyrinogen III oxidase [Merismopedia sp. SIO2A8]
MHDVDNPADNPVDNPADNHRCQSAPVTSAYIHIPFCRRRCYYCDFPISVVGDRPPLQRSQGMSASKTGHGSGAIAAYIPLLCQEIKATPLPADTVPLTTVFFGGGTPSLLGVEQLAAILETLDHHFGIAPGAEISMEMDPDTFTLEQLQGYHALGVNRVSLGLQSFDDQVLEACGRTHRLADIEQAIATLHTVGLTNWSLDLISGLPHLSLELWQETLARAIALHPTHLSVYDLTVEPNTAFDQWYQSGEAPLPSDNATAQMYRMAQAHLTAAGYRHYEVSNYAQPGYECRHNLTYWHNQPYYGFGMGAASYLNHYRFTRPRTRQQYEEWVHQWCDHPMWTCEPTSHNEQLLDTLMLGLRLAEGLSVQPLVENFGEAIAPTLLDTLEPYVKKGWVCLKPKATDSAELQICLTDPEGFLFSNVILSTLFESMEQVREVN